ncbi:MAG: glycosyl hydrolase [Gemmatimonadetes bacterium]|nr:MAG: glycosyl hydrolase [Gemmatimonadota bacterium]
MPRLARLALLTLIVPVSLPAQTVAKYDTSLFRALAWRPVGPFRGGRVTAVAGVLDQPLVYYMGATGGGVWKTTDGGLTWQATSDKDFTAGSIGAIAVAPSDPNVVYVGTGESPIRGNLSPGDGMYRSTDAGKTWAKIGLADAGQIAHVAVHPRNADLVYVAVLGHAFGPNTTRGVFRSKDGGKTWEKILFKNDSTGAIDLAMDPTNPRILYVGFWQAVRRPWELVSGGPGSGIWKSTDGGDTWKEITRSRGLPQGIIGKIGLAVSPVSHERVWALVEADSGGLFRSNDGGATWARSSGDNEIRQRAWYFTHVVADPGNLDGVYVLNVTLLKSVDAGKTFTNLHAPHGDHHALWIDPRDPQRMINGNDGGATVSQNGGATWTTLDNQPTAQFYHVITTTHFPYRLCGAQQDNSTVCIASRSDRLGITAKDWYEVGGGESGWIAARQDDPDVVFAGSYGGYITRFDRRTGQARAVNAWPDNPMGWGAAALKYRFQWTFPIVLSPTNPNDLYIGAQVLFKSVNDGRSWQVISPDLTRNETAKQGPSGGPITKDNTSIEYYNTIFTVAPSPRDSQLIWVGTDDGLVQVTRDGGRTWQNVTPRDLPEGALVSTVEASPHDPATAYLAATRYKLDDARPYAYKTADYGKTWRKIVAGIPADHFVRVVREDPARRGLLFAGTEFGVYMSLDDGAAWQPLRLNLPVVPIHDLTLKDHDLVAATHGRAFWILDDITPLEQLTDDIARGGNHLFRPRDAVRLQGPGFTPERAVTDVGTNPPHGAIIYAYVKDKPEAEATLEILDARDSLVRRISSRPTEGQDTLKVEAGLNRLVWDLRYADAHRFKGLVFWAGGTRGPLAPPGVYRARLTLGAWSETQPFTVVTDPRVAATAEDLRKQFELLVRIRDRVSAANDAVQRIAELEDQIDAVAKRARALPEGKGAGLARQADSLKSKLAAVQESIHQVRNKAPEDPLNFPIKVNNKLASLGGVVGSADAAPTDQSYQVFDQLAGELQGYLDRLKTMIETDVPAFNRAAREQDIPAVMLK